MDIQCHMDQDGIFRANAAEQYSVLASLLEQDIEGSVNACESYIAALQAVKSGKDAHWKATGNAHAVEVRQDHVEIRNLWDTEVPTVALTLEDFESALKSWLKCISKQKT